MILFVEIMENMDKEGTHSTKMGADKSAENTPNAPQIVGPICLSMPKSLGLLFLSVRSPWGRSTSVAMETNQKNEF